MKKYFGILVLLFLACKKEDNLRKKLMKGIVVHAQTLEPIRNQQVILNIYTQKIARNNDIEYPNGQLVTRYMPYETFTDINGRYEVLATIPNEKWSYSVTASTGDFITTRQLIQLFPYDESIEAISGSNDSVHMERAGYVKYTINTMGSVFENEALYLHTPYTRKYIRQDGYSNGFMDYNYLFFGKLATVINDTIPVDKAPRVEVKWLHLHLDTLHYKVDTILVEPKKTTPYSIQY